MPHPTPKPPPPLGTLLWRPFLLFSLAPPLDQTLRWSNHALGFYNGILHIVVFFPSWLLLVVPWTVLIHALCRWRQRRRFLAWWTLAPACLPLAFVLIGLLLSPPTSHHRFHQFTGTNLPANAADLHHHFEGGGIADYGDTYSFGTTPNEVDRLIHDLDLEEVPSHEAWISPSILSPLPDSPDFRTWEGGTTYQTSKRNWHTFLLTDAKRTKVYLYICRT